MTCLDGIMRRGEGMRRDLNPPPPPTPRLELFHSVSKHSFLQDLDLLDLKVWNVPILNYHS